MTTPHLVRAEVSVLQFRRWFVIRFADQVNWSGSRGHFVYDIDGCRQAFPSDL